MTGAILGAFGSGIGVVVALVLYIRLQRAQAAQVAAETRAHRAEDARKDAEVQRDAAKREAGALRENLKRTELDLATCDDPVVVRARLRARLHDPWRA